jgi:hypothetical protein
MIISIPLSANIEGMRIGLKKKRKAKKNLRESKGQYLEIFQVEAECPNGLLLLKLKHPWRDGVLKKGSKLDTGRRTRYGKATGLSERCAEDMTVLWHVVKLI